MLAYQFGYDQYVFAVGGEKFVQEGAIPFRDVMDTKPLLMMYIYGWASAFFGYTVYSIRIVDVLYHLVALYVYFRLLRTYFTSESVAYIAVAIYALQYVSTGAAATAQAESFALLPTLGILYATGKIEQIQKKKDILYLITLTSVCAFVLFALKITLILIPLVICMWKIIDNPQHRKRHIIHFIGMIAGFGICLMCLLLWLSVNGAIPFVKEYLTWLSEYKSQSDTLNSITFYSGYFVSFISNLSHSTSLSLLLVTSIGVYVSYTDEKRYWSKNINHTISILLISGLIVILLQNKYILYQYALFWWIFSTFAALGVYTIFRLVKQHLVEKKHNPFSIALVTFSTLMFIFFSPLTNILNHLYQRTFPHEHDKNDFIEFFRPSKSLPIDLDSIQAKLAPILKDEDKIFFFGHHVGVHFHSVTLPTTMALTSAYLTADWTPNRWRKHVLYNLQKSPPRFIIVEDKDAIPLTNRSPLDSRQHFENWVELADFTHAHYLPLDSTEKFIVYKKRSE